MDERINKTIALKCKCKEQRLVEKVNETWCLYVFHICIENRMKNLRLGSVALIHDFVWD